MILKAGTYRFNDVLTEAEFEQSINLTVGGIEDGVAYTVYASKISAFKIDYFAIFFMVDSLIVDGEEQLNEETLLPVYSTNGSGWASFSRVHTITEDTEVDDTFGTWYKANTDYDAVNGITITWDGQIEGREAITISFDGTIETVGHLIGEIELDDINSLIGATFEVYADSSKGEISYIDSPITDITKVSEGMYQFGSFNLSTDNGITGYHYIFTYAIKGVYSWEIVEGVVATITVPKTGIYSEVQQAQTEPTYIPYVYPSKLTIPALPTKTKKFTRLYLGAIAHSSNGKRFRKLQTEEYVEPTLEAGLYDADDNLVASWDTLGMDVEKKYNSSSYLSDKTHPRYVMATTSGLGNGTKLVIPDSVRSIGSYAFYNCKSFTSIVMPDGVTSIGTNAFESCTSLTSIKIPDSVTTLYPGAFSHCSSLTSAVIPHSVTNIGNWAFQGCASLIDITIPNSVTSIGYDALWECTSLTNINFRGTIEQWYNITLGTRWNGDVPAQYIQCTDGVVWLTGSEGLLFAANSDSKTCEVTGIGTCTDTDIVIPYTSPEGYTVTSIGNSAFMNCTSFESIRIPNTVTKIDSKAFQYCSSLTSVVIPNSVTSVGYSTFESCTSLTSAVIGDSLINLGQYMFKYCTSLTSVKLPNSVTSITWGAFDTCASLTSIDMPESVTSIGDDAFGYCTSLTHIIIPDNVTSIGKEALAYCRSLTYISIGKSVSSIGDRAFYQHRNIIAAIDVDTDNQYYKSVDGHLYTKDGTTFVWCAGGNGASSVVLLGSVTSIGELAFIDCKSLESVTIPYGVTTMEQFAFGYCTSLTSIDIPDSVTNIGWSAFYGCESLESINFAGTTEQWKSITLGEHWNENIIADYVQCTDGHVAL